MFWNASNQGANEAGNVGILGGVPQGQLPIGGQIAGNGGSGFYRIRNEVLLDNSIPDYYLCFLECLVYITPGSDPVESLVIGSILVELWRAVLHRFFRVNYCREWFVVNIYKLQGVFGLVAGFGDHYGYGIAHVPRHIPGYRRVRYCLNVRVGGYPGAGDRVEDTIGIDTGIDGQHPRGGLSGAGADASDAGVSVGTVQYGGVNHPGQFNIVGVSGLTGNQPGVFPPSDSRTKNSSSHGLTSHDFSSGPGCFHNVLVSGAAADIAFQAVPDFLVGGVGVALEQFHHRHNHTGSAVAALKAVIVPEGFLDGVQVTILGQPFNGGEVGPVGLYSGISQIKLISLKM
jgi:hypothetical protein